MNNNNASKKSVHMNPFEGGGLSNLKYIKAPKAEAPLPLKEIFKNKTNIETILNYLNNYKVGTDNKIKGIILRGNIGCGKITLIKSCLGESKYSNVLFDTDYETDDVFYRLTLAVESKGLAKILSTNAKKAIIIRDIDNALKPTQKSDFYKFLVNSQCSLPVFMTSCDNSVGVCRDVPRHILQLDFELPTISELVKYFWKDPVTKKISKNAFEKVLSDSNFDMRYIINFINGLNTREKKITITKASEISKDIELDTFSSIKFCANPEKSLESKLNYSSLYTDVTIFHNYPNYAKNVEMCEIITDMCSFSDLIINHVFENQEWGQMDDTYNYIGTIAPLNYLVKNGVKIDKLTYPSSNLLYQNDLNEFNILDKDSFQMNIIVSLYFKNDKFVGNSQEFNKIIKRIKDPIKAYKLGNMLTSLKKTATIIKELKKVIN